VVEDAAAARIAALQEGVLTIEQLRRAGLSRNAIRHRVDHRVLQRLWRGVYLLGPLAPGPYALAMAAVLTCRGTAVVSHRWASALWGFLPFPAVPVDVTVATGSHRGRKEVRVHRTSLTDARDFTSLRRIPITSPARTLINLAEAEPADVVQRALGDAQVMKRVNERTLQQAIARCGRNKGALRLSRLIEPGVVLTRSEAERLMLALIRQAGLPKPLVNVKVGRYEVDFLWPGLKLIVEVDGYAFHGSHRSAWERDQRRRSELAAMGYNVLPVTWVQLTQEPYAVVARLTRAIENAA
jgi:very-short-patch-repair endonuclease